MLLDVGNTVPSGISNNIWVGALAAGGFLAATLICAGTMLFAGAAASQQQSPPAQATAGQAPPSPAQATQPPSGTAPAGAPPQTPDPAQAQQNGLNMVVLDPAHGGTDLGARGTGGMRESEIVMEFAEQVRRALDTPANAKV